MPSTNKHLQPSPTCRKAKVLSQPCAAKLRSQAKGRAVASPSPCPFGIRMATAPPASFAQGSGSAQPWWPPLSWVDRGAKWGLFLQHNSLATQHFPTEGPPNAWIILLFSFPRLQSISPASPVSWKAAGSCFTEEFLLRKLSTLEPFPSVPTSTLV